MPLCVNVFDMTTKTLRMRPSRIPLPLHWVWFIAVAKASLLPVAYIIADAVEPFGGKFFG